MTRYNTYTYHNVTSADHTKIIIKIWKQLFLSHNQNGQFRGCHINLLSYTNNCIHFITCLNDENQYWKTLNSHFLGERVSICLKIV